MEVKRLLQIRLIWRRIVLLAKASASICSVKLQRKSDNSSTSPTVASTCVWIDEEETFGLVFRSAEFRSAGPQWHTDYNTGQSTTLHGCWTQLSRYGAVPQFPRLCSANSTVTTEQRTHLRIRWDFGQQMALKVGKLSIMDKFCRREWNICACAWKAQRDIWSLAKPWRKGFWLFVGAFGGKIEKRLQRQSPAELLEQLKCSSKRPSTKKEERCLCRCGQEDDGHYFYNWLPRWPGSVPCSPFSALFWHWNTFPTCLFIFRCFCDQRWKPPACCPCFQFREAKYFCFIPKGGSRGSAPKCESLCGLLCQTQGGKWNATDAKNSMARTSDQTVREWTLRCFVFEQDCVPFSMSLLSAALQNKSETKSRIIASGKPLESLTQNLVWNLRQLKFPLTLTCISDRTLLDPVHFWKNSTSWLHHTSKLRD